MGTRALYRSAWPLLLALLVSTAGCGGDAVADVDSDQDEVTIAGAGARLADLVEKARGVSVLDAVFGEMKTVVQNAGRDAGAQRRALEELLGARLPAAVTAADYLTSMEAAVRALKTGEHAAGSLAHVDGMLSELFSSPRGEASVFQQILRALDPLQKAEKVPRSALSELLLAFAWSQEEKEMVAGIFHVAILIDRGQAQDVRKVAFLLEALVGNLKLAPPAPPGSPTIYERWAQLLLEQVGKSKLPGGDPAKFPHLFYQSHFKDVFGFEYPRPQDFVARTLAIFDAARTATLRSVEAGGSVKVEGGLVRSVTEAMGELGGKKKFADAVKGALAEQDVALKEALRLVEESKRSFGAALLAPIQKTALVRAQTTQRILKDMIRVSPSGAITFIEASGARTTVTSLDQLNELLGRNWDVLYAQARL